MIRIGNRRGFTILEMITAITIFSVIMLSVLMAVQSLSIARVKSLNRIALLDELYFFSEQLFTQVKEGGTLDYEEYWNRKVVSTATQSGYYSQPTGVGNYGRSGDIQANTTGSYGWLPYLCRSNNGVPMGVGGCLTNHNNGSDGSHSGVSANYAGQYQRFGQYALQFIDYNHNADNDGGDEDDDPDHSIIGDDDDYVLADMESFSGDVMKELYLINKNDKTRTFFRWVVRQDLNAPAGMNCTITEKVTTTGTGLETGTGCVGNIQVLRLRGYDQGWTHTGDPNTDKTAYDGVIDTWVCKKDWNCSGPNIGLEGNLATGKDAEWVDLFPSSINVRNFSLQIYPTKDPWLAWASPDCPQDGSQPNCVSPFIHPYVRVNLELGFAWGKRRVIRNDNPKISISTSISLHDFY